MTPDGLLVRPSRFDPSETMDRLAAAAAARGMNVVARIDHAAAASEVGLSLRPNAVLIFGNPRVGTHLMAAAQTAGIDLPLRALVYETERGETLIAVNDPAWIARRHGASEIDAVVAAIGAALGAVVEEATGGG